jgi:hypothetical protein
MSRYRDFSVNELGVTTWNLPIVLGRFRPLEGHIHSYVSRCMAQVEWYHHDPNEALLASTRRALDFMLHQNGMVITGGNYTNAGEQYYFDGYISDPTNLLALRHDIAETVEAIGKAIPEKPQYQKVP